MKQSGSVFNRGVNIKTPDANTHESNEINIQPDDLIQKLRLLSIQTLRQKLQKLYISKKPTDQLFYQRLVNFLK